MFSKTMNKLRRQSMAVVDNNKRPEEEDEDE